MKQKEEERYTAFRWLILLFGALGLFDLQMTYLSVAPVLQEIASSVGLDSGAATIVLMSSFLAAASFVWLTAGGYLCDRFGVLTSLTLGFLCLAAPAALAPWIGGSFYGLLWIRIVEGFSMGLMFPTIPAIANTLFPARQRGLASGLLSSAVALGNSVGLVLGPMVLKSVGGDWKRMTAALSILGWAGMVTGLVLCFTCSGRLPRREEFIDNDSQQCAFRKAIFSPLSILGIATSFLAVWSLQGIYGLAPTFLAAGKPLGAGYGAVSGGQLALGATLLAGGCGPILNGFLLDKVFHGRVKWNLYLGFTLMCVCVFLLRFPGITGKAEVLELDLILAGLGPMLVFPTMFYLSACSYPPQIVGKVGGLWSGVGNLGGVFCTYFAGIMIRTQNSYDSIFALQALIAALGIVVTVILVRLHKPIYLASALAYSANACKDLGCFASSEGPVSMTEKDNSELVQRGAFQTTG
jgi:MFS family permease